MQKEKADAHANRTIWLAGRAMAITILAQMLDDSVYELPLAFSLIGHARSLLLPIESDA